MLILPAIDLKDGKCVRLLRGDFSTTHQVSDNPLETAVAFASAGAKIIHMVDLDGARDGVRKNAAIIAEVCEKSGLFVELGGGLRTMRDLEDADHIGVYRFVIGSAAVSDPDFVEEAVKKYGVRVAVGVDAKNGFVRTHGWEKDSGIDAIEFSKKMAALGVKTIIYTDIDTDGTLAGPAADAVRELSHNVDADIVASGGIGSIDDVRRVMDAGASGVIIGKAYYSGRVDITEAVKLGGAQCLPRE